MVDERRYPRGNPNRCPVGSKTRTRQVLTEKSKFFLSWLTAWGSGMASVCLMIDTLSPTTTGAHDVTWSQHGLHAPTRSRISYYIIPNQRSHFSIYAFKYKKALLCLCSPSTLSRKHCCIQTSSCDFKMITIENYANFLLCKFRIHSVLCLKGVEDFTNQLLIQKPLLCVYVTRPFMYIQNI